MGEQNYYKKYRRKLLNRDNAKFYENSEEGATKSTGMEAERESGSLQRWGTPVRGNSMCSRTEAWEMVECSKTYRHLSVHETWIVCGGW